MIRRKDTLGFVDFMRGKYSIYNKEYILNMIKQMTNDEKTRILTEPFSKLWGDLWGNPDTFTKNVVASPNSDHFSFGVRGLSKQSGGEMPLTFRRQKVTTKTVGLAEECVEDRYEVSTQAIETPLEFRRHNGAPTQRNKELKKKRRTIQRNAISFHHFTSS